MCTMYMYAGAPNFGKTWEGDNLFQPGAPKTLEGLIHIERPMIQNFGVHFARQTISKRGG